MRLTWLGHATVAIEMDGVRLLTDPVLSKRIAFLRRVVPAPAEVARPDAVLLTHLHRDHLDLPTLRRIDADVPVLAPLGSREMLERAGRRAVVEMLPGDQTPVGAVVVRATAAAHDGGSIRAPRSRSSRAVHATALGFVAQGTGSVYHAGDTALFPGMAGLAEDLDVALVPVGGWAPRLGPGHLDADDAARALQLLRPRVAIPIHWGTYAPAWMARSSGHLRMQGLAFAKAAAKMALPTEIRLMTPGQSTEIDTAG